MLSAILSLVFLPALCVSSGSSQAYLYPYPSSPAQFSGTALLAHHLGLEAYESPPLETSTGEIVLGSARPFVGEGQPDALLISVDARHPDDMMPQALHPSFVLPLSIESPSSLIKHYSRLARKTYHSVADAASRSSQHHSPRFLNIFDLTLVSSVSKSDALERFLTSLNNVAAFVEKSQRDRGVDRFGSFEVIGLKDIEEEWGRESEQYLTSVAAVNATIQSAIANEISLAVIFPSHLSVRQLVQPPQSPFPAPEKIPANAPVFSTSTCFTSVDMCRNATASCSTRGECVSATRAGRTCFVCECRKAPLEIGGKNISWAGSMCQKQDISQEFTLIVTIVIFLILVSVGSISLLYTIGNQELPGTLTGGVGPSKRE